MAATPSELIDLFDWLEGYLDVYVHGLSHYTAAEQQQPREG